MYDGNKRIKIAIESKARGEVKYAGWFDAMVGCGVKSLMW